MRSRATTDLEEADVQHDGLVVVDGLISEGVRGVPKTRCQLRVVRCSVVSFDENAQTDDRKEGGEA